MEDVANDVAQSLGVFPLKAEQLKAVIAFLEGRDYLCLSPLAMGSPYLQCWHHKAFSASFSELHHLKLLPYKQQTMLIDKQLVTVGLTRRGRSARSCGICHVGHPGISHLLTHLNLGASLDRIYSPVQFTRPFPTRVLII